MFRGDDKQHIVFLANRLAIAGLAFLAAAMGGALLLVSSRLFGIPIGVLTLAGSAIPFGVLWFAMPLSRRRQLRLRRTRRAR